MNRNSWINLVPAERKRTYIFPETDLVFENVTAIFVTLGGTHYLEHGTGKKSIVVPGWIGIDIDVDEWTYPKRGA
jgi:hypothetical protein